MKLTYLGPEFRPELCRTIVAFVCTIRYDRSLTWNRKLSIQLNLAYVCAVCMRSFSVDHEACRLVIIMLNT